MGAEVSHASIDPVKSSIGANDSELALRATSLRFSNFDLLRLIAAASVVFSHAFAVTEGHERNEPLVMLLGAGNILGLYGVYTFFIFSGLLITASFQKSSLSGYAIKRCLRIYPGLICCVLLTTVLALMLSSEGEVSRWKLVAGIRYATKTLLFMDTSGESLPGVVFSTNDFGWLINGSLWSLGPEFLCYIAIAVLGLARLLGIWTALVLTAVGFYTHLNGLLGNLGFVLPFFFAGAVAHFWKRRPQLNVQSFGFAVSGLVLMAVLGWPTIGFAVFGSWLIISFATSSHQIPGATRFGDLSYGIYLYGWPIEQTVRYLLGEQATWWMVFLISMPLAALTACASWHIVERPALGMVRMTSGR